MNSAKQFGKTYDLDVDALLEEDEPKPRPKAGKAASTGNPMDAEVDGTPFSVLMNQAVKMKSAQQAPMRENFDSWPRYYQNSIFASDEIKKARSNASFEEKMKFAESLKSGANELLGSGKLLDANHMYEQALSLFIWAENTNPDWKNSGMKDTDLKEDSFTDYKSEDERKRVTEFLKVSACESRSNEPVVTPNDSQLLMASLFTWFFFRLSRPSISTWLSAAKRVTSMKLQFALATRSS